MPQTVLGAATPALHVVAFNSLYVKSLITIHAVKERRVVIIYIWKHMGQCLHLLDSMLKYFKASNTRVIEFGGNKAVTRLCDRTHCREIM